MAGLAALAAAADCVVLGADTSVVLDGRILGKPESRAEALATLAALSGREHYRQAYGESPGQTLAS